MAAKKKDPQEGLDAVQRVADLNDRLALRYPREKAWAMFYEVGPSRTPLCARCMDRANTIRREIQAVHAVSTPRPKPHHPEDCPFATGDRRTWFYCEACDHDVPRAQLTLFSPPDKEDP